MFLFLSDLFFSKVAAFSGLSNYLVEYNVIFTDRNDTFSKMMQYSVIYIFKKKLQFVSHENWIRGTNHTIRNWCLSVEISGFHSSERSRRSDCTSNNSPTSNTICQFWLKTGWNVPASVTGLQSLYVSIWEIPFIPSLPPLCFTLSCFLSFLSSLSLNLIIYLLVFLCHCFSVTPLLRKQFDMMQSDRLRV